MLENFKKKDYRAALQELFLKLDVLMLSKDGQKELQKLAMSQQNGSETGFASDEGKSYAGCTASVLLITKTDIYTANAGDSRTVLCKKGKAKDLSEDHKPELPSERNRIERANGYVEDKRVNGMLALSRALGDFEYKSNPLLKPHD